MSCTVVGSLCLCRLLVVVMVVVAVVAVVAAAQILLCATLHCQCLPSNGRPCDRSFPLSRSSSLDTPAADLRPSAIVDPHPATPIWSMRFPPCPCTPSLRALRCPKLGARPWKRSPPTWHRRLPRPCQGRELLPRAVPGTWHYPAATRRRTDERLRCHAANVRPRGVALRCLRRQKRPGIKSAV